jgi:PAS domain S-box-containing protein
MTMPEFIRANLEQILSDWEVFASTLLPAAAALPAKELRDFAEEMLQAIASDMETSQSSSQKGDKSKGLLIDPASRMEVSARRHAADRWAHTFSLDQVVAEYRALRASVIRHWTEQLPGSGAVEIEEMTRFNEAIDESLTISVVLYHAELKASETRYRTLFESIDEGFCIVEVVFDEQDRPIDYRFLETNPAFDHQSGLANAEGKRMRDLEPRHEEHWFQRYGRVSLTRRPERFVHKAEHLGGRWFDVYAFPVGAEEQRRVGILFRDVSEQKRMEEALRQADRAKDEFLAVLGHELRNPLAPLQSGLDLLEQTPGGAQLLDRIVPMMRRQLSHLVRLVDDLLDISRVSRGKIELQRHRIDVGAPARAAVEQVRPLVSSRKHQLRLRLSEEDLPVLGDFERLTQAVANLLSNAAKYTEPGGTITVTTGQDRGQAFVSVRDTGIGLSPIDRGHLFKLFSQIVDHQGHQRGGGLGVGLALSRQLVELHDGSIEVQSKGRGQGSEFVIRLPLAEDDPERSSSASTDAALRGPTFRILVVDDNSDAAESLGMLLEAGGHSVETAYDGLSALQLVEEFRPDVVLLDLGLPEMDGVEVAGRVRAMPDGRRVHIVAVTGWEQDEDKARASEPGFDGHLTKPIDAQDLAAVFARLTRLE